MAIGAVARGDIVCVHAPRLSAAAHGLFVVDSVAGNVVKVFAPENANAVAGGDKSGIMVLDKQTDILSVCTASSLSV